MGDFVSRLGSTNLSTLPSLSKSHISELVQAGRANPLVRPLRSRRSMVQYDIIPQNSYSVRWVTDALRQQYTNDRGGQTRQLAHS